MLRQEQLCFSLSLHYEQYCLPHLSNDPCNLFVCCYALWIKQKRTEFKKIQPYFFVAKQVTRDNKYMEHLHHICQQRPAMDN